MSMRRGVRVAAVVAMLASASWSRAAAACDCPVPKTAAQELAAAQAVVVARVAKVETSGQTTTIRLEVSRAWKGARPGDVLVIERRGLSDCDYALDEGTTHLLYLERGVHPSAPLEARAPHCTRSRPLADADEEMRALDAIGPPRDDVDVVHLHDGTAHVGRISEIVPGDHVTLIVAGGETKRFAWASVDRIDVSAELPAEAPPVPPEPAVIGPIKAAAPPAQPYTQWRANRPLLVTGAILFGAGYGPNLVAGLPSTVGLVGRVVILVLTVGLPCLFGGSGYLCKGQHGGVELLIPFAGPILYVNDHPRDTVLNPVGMRPSSTMTALLYTSAGLQIAGITAILTGIALGKQETIYPKSSGSSPRWFVSPFADGSSAGLSFSLTRW